MFSLRGYNVQRYEREMPSDEPTTLDQKVGIQAKGQNIAQAILARPPVLSKSHPSTEPGCASNTSIGVALAT